MIYLIIYFFKICYNFVFKIHAYVYKGDKLERQNTITRENLRRLMTQFYYQALDDVQIGHFFLIELGDNLESEEWTEHIDLLVNFWATLFLGEERYKGDPYGPHFTIVGLKQKDFDRWVELFSQIADEVYTPEIATLFKEKGMYYAQDFMRRLNTARKEEDLKRLKSKIGWE